MTQRAYAHTADGATRRPWLGLLRQRLWGALPSQCLMCHAWPSQALCPECEPLCWQTAPRRCPRCALHLPGSSDVCAACLRNAPVLARCYAAVDYSPPWDGVVQQLKFHQQPAWASLVAHYLLRTPGVAACLQQADVVLPVPLAPARLRERGYNQSALIAKQLLTSLQPMPAPTLRQGVLLRLTDTPAQSQLGRAARLRNLRHAFALDPAASASLRGQRVVLVDDVMTTGATLSTLANRLLAHGVSAVDAIVFARTPAPHWDD